MPKMFMINTSPTQLKMKRFLKAKTIPSLLSHLCYIIHSLIHKIALNKILC